MTPRTKLVIATLLALTFPLWILPALLVGAVAAVGYCCFQVLDDIFPREEAE